MLNKRWFKTLEGIVKGMESPTSLGERLVIPRFGSWATGLRGKPSQGPGGTGQSLLPLCH